MRPHERFINCSERGPWLAIIQFSLHTYGFTNFRCDCFDVVIKCYKTQLLL